MIATMLTSIISMYNNTIRINNIDKNEDTSAKHDSSSYISLDPLNLSDIILSTPVKNNYHFYSDSSIVSNISRLSVIKDKNEINIVTKSMYDNIDKNSNEAKNIKENIVKEPVEEVQVVEEITIEEPVEEVQVVEEITTVPEPEIYLSNEEVELIALLTMAEAEGESELGKRLVIDTVLNQVESEGFPNTVKGVIYSGAYIAMHNGRSSQCYVDEYICQLVREEAMSRTNSKVLYFRTRHYHNFGTPEIHEGNHYFSS